MAVNEVVIRQGSNSPILLEFDVEASIFNKMSAVLVDANRVRKTWTLDNAVVSGKTIKLPLTETETLTLGPGTYKLDVKCMDATGTVLIYNIVSCIIERRYNRTVMGGS